MGDFELEHVQLTSRVERRRPRWIPVFIWLFAAVMTFAAMGISSGTEAWWGLLAYTLPAPLALIGASYTATRCVVDRFGILAATDLVQREWSWTDIECVWLPKSPDVPPWPLRFRERGGRVVRVEMMPPKGSGMEDRLALTGLAKANGVDVFEEGNGTSRWRPVASVYRPRTRLSLPVGPAMVFCAPVVLAFLLNVAVLAHG